MNLLLFHTGSLGDTLVVVPALWALRDHFKDARITMLSDSQMGRALVTSREVLEGSGLVDEFIAYPVYQGRERLSARFSVMANLFLTLRRKRFDTLAYLIRERRGDYSARRSWRDHFFFHAAGISQVIGTTGPADASANIGGNSLPFVQNQADEFLVRLSRSGVKVPSPRQGKMSLNVGAAERKGVDDWLAGLPPDGGSPWIAVGPGSKMPTKVWPTERYREVVERLIQKWDVWPVVFGGSEDRQLGEELVRYWGRGHVAAGVLGIRVGIAALQRCRFYLGNDTGTMHMAVAAGIRCVAVFSARDYPGLWYPYGSGHTVFRVQLPCEGCMLEVCHEKGNACLLAIDMDEVYSASARMMEG